MANTSSLYVRMDPNLKSSAEEILGQLGISSSSAVQMFYKQIILQRGMPFNVKLPAIRPTAIGGLSRAELDVELQKGMDSLKSDRTYSVDEADALLAEEFGV